MDNSRKKSTDEGEEQERAEIKESEEKFAIEALHVMSNTINFELLVLTK